VFTTNEAPPQEPIPFHHEMAQIPNPPSHVIFYCLEPAKCGGATPLIDSHLVYNYFSEHHPEFATKVEKLGLRYIRILPKQDDESSPIGRGWISTYVEPSLWNTEDENELKCDAEKKMKELGVEWEWLPHGDLKTISPVLPGVKLNPKTNRKTFF
jgi:hypothetical protein